LFTANFHETNNRFVEGFQNVFKLEKY